jgi:hypothetical protein
VETDQTATKSLKEQLLERIAQAKAKVVRQPVVERETDEEHFHRVYNDESAWTTISRNRTSILPS